DQPRFTLLVKVASEQPLARAEIWRGGSADNALERVDGLTPQNAAAANVTFDLRRGLNRIRVVAANSGDSTEVEVFVSYTPSPVRVVIDSVSEIAPGGKPVPLVLPSEGPIAANGPILEVRGRVAWDNEDDPVARDPNLTAVLQVNRVAHLPVRLE